MNSTILSQKTSTRSHSESQNLPWLGLPKRYYIPYYKKLYRTMGMTFEWFFSQYLKRMFLTFWGFESCNFESSSHLPNISKQDFLNLYFIALKKDFPMLYQTSIILFGPPYDVTSTSESPISSNSHTFQPLYILGQCRHHMIVIYIETFSMNHLMWTIF